MIYNPYENDDEVDDLLYNVNLLDTKRNKIFQDMERDINIQLYNLSCKDSDIATVVVNIKQLMTDAGDILFPSKGYFKLMDSD